MSKSKRASLSSVGLFKNLAATQDHPLQTIASQQPKTCGVVDGC